MRHRAVVLIWFYLVGLYGSYAQTGSSCGCPDLSKGPSTVAGELPVRWSFDWWFSGFSSKIRYCSLKEQLQTPVAPERFRLTWELHPVKKGARVEWPDAGLKSAFLDRDIRSVFVPADVFQKAVPSEIRLDNIPRSVEVQGWFPVNLSSGNRKQITAQYDYFECDRGGKVIRSMQARTSLVQGDSGEPNPAGATGPGPFGPHNQVVEGEDGQYVAGATTTHYRIVLPKGQSVLFNESFVSGREFDTSQGWAVRGIGVHDLPVTRPFSILQPYLVAVGGAGVGYLATYHRASPASRAATISVAAAIPALISVWHQLNARRSLRQDVERWLTRYESQGVHKVWMATNEGDRPAEFDKVSPDGNLTRSNFLFITNGKPEVAGGTLLVTKQ